MPELEPTMLQGVPSAFVYVRGIIPIPIGMIVGWTFLPDTFKPVWPQSRSRVVDHGKPHIHPAAADGQAVVERLAAVVQEVGNTGSEVNGFAIYQLVEINPP